MPGADANPTYRQVCSGRTGHTEGYTSPSTAQGAVRGPHEDILESHDPAGSPGQRHWGPNTAGDHWRGEEQKRAAEASRDAYQSALRASGHGEITTEIAPAPEFYYAEEYHQQYLDKNPGGYCGLGGTGVSCPVGLAAGVKET
jgi:peptide-methionine (S)-S-oxide reductase